MLPISPIDKPIHFEDNDLVCYCFQHTRKNIEDDYRHSGYSKILEEIKAAKKSQGCNCESMNPRGR
jgi:hypothetical protein